MTTHVISGHAHLSLPPLLALSSFSPTPSHPLPPSSSSISSSYASVKFLPSCQFVFAHFRFPFVGFARLSCIRGHSPRCPKAASC